MNGLDGAGVLPALLSPRAQLLLVAMLGNLTLAQ